VCLIREPPLQLERRHKIRFESCYRATEFFASGGNERMTELPIFDENLLQVGILLWVICYMKWPHDATTHHKGTSQKQRYIKSVNCSGHRSESGGFAIDTKEILSQIDSLPSSLSVGLKALTCNLSGGHQKRTGKVAISGKKDITTLMAELSWGGPAATLHEPGEEAGEFANNLFAALEAGY